ncbi:MFS transporter [Variovorax sp. M-6]|uniref:MFS transporter n=1 Tax=Variovorax sp. M-6 TaxID=3233041 RepID=UPI003F98D5E3
MFLAFAIASLASGFAMRVTDPIVLPVAQHLSVDVAMAAWLSPAYALPYAVAQLFLGPLGDRFGKLHCMKVCGVAMALALTLGAFATTFPLLLATRILAGAFAGGLIPLVLATMGERYGMAERQVMIGRMLLAIIGGQMLGSVVSGLVHDALGWRSPLVIAAALAAAASLALLRMPSVPHAAGSARLSTAALYGRVFENPKAPWIYACVVAEGLLFFSLFPFAGALLLARAPGIAGSVASQAGLVLGAFGVGGLLYAVMVRQLIAALGVRRMCLVGAVAAAGCYAAMAFATTWWICAALMGVAGIGFYMIHNSLQTEATELAPAARGSAMALFACGLFAGQGLGPLLAAPLIRSAGFAAFLIAVAVGVLALGAVVVRRIVVPTAAVEPGKGAALRP